MLKNIKLKNKLRKIVSLNSNIADIILFGSVVRGKKNPVDVDVLVLFTTKVDKILEREIRKILEKEYGFVSVISKTQSGILDPAFDARESVLFEGKSILTSLTLGEKYGFKSLGMFKYNISSLNNSAKTKFYYALNGRGTSTGINQKLACIKLSDKVILVPLEKIELFREFLNSWEMDFIYVPLLLPDRLNKKKLLE